MSHLSPVTLRRIDAADLDAILRVQAACYPPTMQEPAAVVATRIKQAADTSTVAVHQNGAILAYAFAYRSRMGAVTPLDAGFDVDPEGDTLYLHDLAVAPEAAGKGLAKRLAAQLLTQARDARLAWSALVSVQDSRGFWEGLGYRAANCVQKDALASYPGPALYMLRPTAA
ncbi:GNAT family N-acetyltransferase [Massilia suwonensis]|uniref:GNAT family N-acetyltransferase n=1 Tax=Massilia suwonensis TaxID=648895 RepID=A0ABW0MP59_9BURK